MFSCSDNGDDEELDFSIFVVGDCSKSQDNHHCYHHLIRDDDDEIDDGCCCDMTSCFGSIEATTGIPDYVTDTIVVAARNAVVKCIIGCLSFTVAVGVIVAHFIACYQAVSARLKAL